MHSASGARKLLSQAIALLLLPLFWRGIASAQGQPAAQHWVGTWAASPQTPPDDTANKNSPDAGFNNQTVRMIVRVSIGGTELRVRFSNAFGSAPVTLGAAHVALAGKGAAILPGSDHSLTFSGRQSFTIPPGALVISDPVNLTVPPLTNLAVSVFLPAQTGPATWHALGNQTTFISRTGDFSSSAELPVVKTTHSWYWLFGVEVLADENTAAIVTLGDSITDSLHSSPDENHRWPDILADQLAEQHSGAHLGVLNEGISGNRLLHDVAGPSALARFDRDVLAQDGVCCLIVLEGINDIGWPHMQGGQYAAEAVSADDIIAAFRQITERAHAHGIRVYGATLTPFGGAFYETPDGEAEREAVNQWIRSSGTFDGVLDFDKLTCDPAHPQQFLPAYDSGDHLHPGDAGYDAMGRAAARLFLSPPAALHSHKAAPGSKVHAGAPR